MWSPSAASKDVIEPLYHLLSPTHLPEGKGEGQSAGLLLRETELCGSAPHPKAPPHQLLSGWLGAPWLRSRLFHGAPRAAPLAPHASQQQPSALVVQLRRAAGLPAAARRLGAPRTDTRLAADTARPGEAALAAEAPTCTDRGPNA